MNLHSKTLNQQLIDDVNKGLSAHPKSLPSKYFYDENGNRLFQRIMELPEYYLTRCEFEILQTYKNDILEAVGKQSFNLIELGAGDASKTKVLIQHFLEHGARFQYKPIDISGNILNDLKANLNKKWPSLIIDPVKEEYFDALQKIDQDSNEPKLILFLGSNIGNMPLGKSVTFLSKLRSKLRSGDQLIIGFDLKKDPDIILKAYNDSQGVTKAFNLNLLKRLNRELGANFNISKFRHWPSYHPISGDAQSFLVSLEEQEVCFSKMNFEVHFHAFEAIDMELSKKYDLEDISYLADQSGFTIEKSFFDKKRYFADSLWKAK